jgi:exodeoxyribonuclease-3
MKIATWNVNSVLARLPGVIETIRETDADVWCLQEIKCLTEAFPSEAFEDLGFHCVVHGQKTYNGVAILSRFPVSDVTRGFPDDPPDAQARYVEALVEAPRPVRIASVYAPNGNPRPGDKFIYKLDWMRRFARHAGTLLSLEEAVILAGDYNCIPRDEDCWDAAVWADDALGCPETRALWRQLIWSGWTDAFMAADGRSHAYTFWDYQAGAWPKDHGIRIDHLLLSPPAADRLTATEALRTVRGREKPSDHVPFVGVFRD